jgi:hypothetical protein
MCSSDGILRSLMCVQSGCWCPWVRRVPTGQLLRACVCVCVSCALVCVCVCVMVSLTQCEVRAGLRARVSRGRTSHSDTCGHARCLSGKRLNSER